MTSRAPLALVLAACVPQPANQATQVPEARISIALYDDGGKRAYGVVDDRRWIVLSAKELVLDNIDPGADLASLTIEPVERIGRGIRIGQCTRARFPRVVSSADVAADRAADRALRHTALQQRIQEHRGGGATTPQQAEPTTMPPPTERFDVTVRCAVEGPAGRYLVRVLYIAPSLRYRVQHEIALSSPDRATVITRIAIATPPWHVRAELAVFDGIPGGSEPPREIARGPAQLDGSIAVISVPTREVGAQLRRIYDGAVPTPEVAATDPSWNHESRPTVWLWLELGAPLARGPAHVHVAMAAEGERDVDVGAAASRDDDHPAASTRLPLWPDDTLRGTRQRLGDPSDGVALAERVLVSVANLGDVRREVWVEERLRPARRRRIDHAWPTKPIASGDRVRSMLAIEPHRVERAGYTIEYVY